MTSRSRRLASALAVLLLAGTAAACGSGDSGSGDSGSGSAGSGATAAGSIPGLDVSGEVGKEPKVDVEGLEVSDEVSTEVVEEGGGPVWETGDFALVQAYVVNGSTGQKALSTYDSDQAQLLKLDSAGGLDEDLVQALEGRRQGSRVAVASSVKTLIGEEGATSAGLGPEDDVVWVIDVVAVAQPVEGEGEVPPGAPEPVLTDGKVTGVDFSDAPEQPGDELQVHTIAEGDGPAIAKGDTAVLRYFGVVYGRSKPFDESFSSEAPSAFPIGVGNLIQGWDQGLIGVKQGSRVLMVIPPEQGYGEKGSPPSIPGNATLVFVIDVLGVAS